MPKLVWGCSQAIRLRHISKVFYSILFRYPTAEFQIPKPNISLINPDCLLWGIASDIVSTSDCVFFGGGEGVGVGVGVGVRYDKTYQR